MMEDAEVEKGTSLWADAWQRLQKNRLSMVCLYTFGAVSLICFLGAWIYPVDPNATNLENRSQSPSLDHPFGTEHLGRDLFARMLHGGTISLTVGFVATLVSVTIGIVYGTIAGYVGGRVDAILMRIVDVLYSLPFTIIVILLATFFGDYLRERNIDEIWVLLVAIGCVEWLTMARIVRGQILSLKKQAFVEAAVSLGHHPLWIMFRHLVPNVLGPVIVYTTLTVPAVMRLEAILSFLGLGIQPPKSSWGTLIKEGADRMQSDPWLLFLPALVFSVTLFCLNFLGDGLRDALDPKSSRD